MKRTVPAATNKQQWALRDQRGHTIPCASRQMADRWLDHPGITVTRSTQPGDCTGCGVHHQDQDHGESEDSALAGSVLQSAAGVSHPEAGTWAA